MDAANAGSPHAKAQRLKVRFFNNCEKSLCLANYLRQNIRFIKFFWETNIPVDQSEEPLHGPVIHGRGQA